MKKFSLKKGISLLTAMVMVIGVVTVVPAPVSADDKDALYDDFSLWGHTSSSYDSLAPTFFHPSAVAANDIRSARRRLANTDPDNPIVIPDKTFFGDFDGLFNVTGRGSRAQTARIVYDSKGVNWSGKMLIWGMTTVRNLRLDKDDWKGLYDAFRNNFEVHVNTTNAGATSSSWKSVPITHFYGGDTPEGGMLSVAVVVENLPENANFVRISFLGYEDESDDDNRSNKDQFLFVRVTDNKSILNDAIDIKTYSPGDPPLFEVETNAVRTTGLNKSIVLEVRTAFTVPSNRCIHVALYKEVDDDVDQLIGYMFVPVVLSKHKTGFRDFYVVLEDRPDADYAKVFVWMPSMKPITIVKKIPITEYVTED